MLLLLAVAAQAQQRTYIEAGRLIDTLAGRVLDEQVIVVAGERIESVSARADIAIPASARVIDLSDHTVMPGLIDMHVHLTFDHRYHGYRRLELTVSRQAIQGVMNARKTLDAGFTTVRNVGGAEYTAIALRDAINAGEVPGPRVRAAGPALGITGGHCEPHRYNHRDSWPVRARENASGGALLELPETWFRQEEHDRSE